MSEIVEEENRLEEANSRKKQKSASQGSNFGGGSEITIEDDFDDYDNFVSKMLTCHILN